MAVAALAAAAWLWWGGSPDEREIRRRVASFAADFNDGTTEGLASVARAARLGGYFTEDVVVELGHGSPPIEGRETLVGMAARLQPRTAAFDLTFEDVTIESLDGDRAETSLTAVIRRRSVSSGEQSLDAREFAAELTRSGGVWRVRRIVAVDTLR